MEYITGLITGMYILYIILLILKNNKYKFFKKIF